MYHSMTIYISIHTHTLSILAYIHKITNRSTGLLTNFMNYRAFLGPPCTGPGPRTWALGPWETDIRGRRESSELPEMPQDIATRRQKNRYRPPRDALQPSEKRNALSLERNASRGGLFRFFWPPVAISRGILGSSDDFARIRMSVSLWTVGGFGDLGFFGGVGGNGMEKTDIC